MAELSLDDDHRCATWTARQGWDPVGSATRFDRLVVVEAPLPWPADVSELAWMSGLAVPARTRVQAVVPDAPAEGGPVRLTRWERRDARLVGLDWLVPTAEVRDGLAALLAGREPDGRSVEAPEEILVCAHGTRDRCCGGAGTRLMLEAQAKVRDVRIRRTSHLGGHRFAPTALTLPDGRMWAFLDAGALAGIVRRTIPPAEAREFYRGNVALDPWAQVVEAAVLADSGWACADFDELEGRTEVEEGGRRADVRLSWSSGGTVDSRSAAVEVATRYPVLQCGLPPEEATKDAPEYRMA